MLSSTESASLSPTGCSGSWTVLPESWRSCPSLRMWHLCAGCWTGSLCLPVWTTRSWSSCAKSCTASLHTISIVCCSGTSLATLSALGTSVCCVCSRQDSGHMETGPFSTQDLFCGTCCPQPLSGHRPWLHSGPELRLSGLTDCIHRILYIELILPDVCSAFEWAGDMVPYKYLIIIIIIIIMWPFPSEPQKVGRVAGAWQACSCWTQSCS